MSLRSLFIGLLVIVSAAAPTHAAVVAGDDPHFGPGSIAVDLSTGYEWLSPRLSTNRSIQDVSSQFGPGGDFAGFRYATQGELVAFWESAGLSIGFGNPTGPYETFLSLMGGPTETGGPYGSAGRIVSYVSTQQAPGAYYAPDVGVFFGGGFAHESNCCASVTQVVPQGGSWLVRVPGAPPAKPFKCYEIKPTLYAPEGNVEVDDELYTLLRWEAQRPWNLCAPAAIGTGPVAPEVLAGTHLEGYSAKLTPTNPPQAPPPPVRITVTDQFGTVVADTDKAFRMLVPTNKSLTGYPPVPTDLNNYLCYTIKLTQAFTQITGVRLTDQFTDHKLYNLAQPYNLCVPASVEGSGVGNAGSYYLCYKALRTSGQGNFVTVNGLYLNNAFGPERANTEKEEDFCVPATVEVP